MMAAAEALIESIKRDVLARRDIVTGQTVEWPAIMPTTKPVDEARFSRCFPVLGQLDAALRLALKGPLAHLAEAILRVRDDLNWSQNASYTDQTCSRAFLDGYAYASLSGPDGPVFWDAPRTGVMLMGADVLYPGHNHAPREIYLMLTGGARWRLDGGHWFDVQAGDLVYHDSWQMHEMRTGDAPLLAIAGWVEPGDRTAIAWDPKRRGATV